MANFARKFGKVSAGTRARLAAVGKFGLDQVLGVLGIGACINLVQEMRR